MMAQKPNRPILIAGPTASGKSALAVALAAKRDGVIVNADSMQVYEELRILTARPSLEDEAAVPHKLYGYIPAAQSYSLGRWLSDVARKIEDAQRSGATPIIVGGTGLYFKALLEGLAPVPDIPAEVRERWRERSSAMAVGELHAALEDRDPVMAARLAPQDPQRIVRALEVIDATGKSLSTWQENAGPPLLEPAEVTALVVAPERAVVYARCDARFAAMIESGALDEVAALANQGLDTELPAMRALGMAALRAHLAGEITLDEAAKRVKTDTRRYAKRQLTWLRSNMITWKWFFEKDLVRLTPKIFAFIDS